MSILSGKKFEKPPAAKGPQKNFLIVRAHCQSCGWFLYAAEPSEFEDVRLAPGDRLDDKPEILRKIKCPSCEKLGSLDSWRMADTRTARDEAGALESFRGKVHRDSVYRLHEQLENIRKALGEIETIIKLADPQDILDHNKAIDIDAFDGDGEF